MGLLNDLRPVEGVGATIPTEPLEFLIIRLLLKGFFKETGHNPKAFQPALIFKSVIPWILAHL